MRTNSHAHAHAHARTHGFAALRYTVRTTASQLRAETPVDGTGVAQLVVWYKDHPQFSPQQVIRLLECGPGAQLKSKARKDAEREIEAMHAVHVAQSLPAATHSLLHSP